MVDVADKSVTVREALAECLVKMAPATLRAVKEGTAKGDAIQVARVAGIMAAKRTPDLIALCHPLPIDKAGVEVTIDADAGEVVIRAEVETTARTGVEMEALTAASVAALNVYDLVKGIDKDIVIESVRLLEKTKGAPPETP